ncbi:hypothetical protein GCM10010420_21750 [Streptomyces glaucosporus]|uniref:Uncharacterized protein n=1 Tax=Streptomyces glaucosporus TaxID=284044 RepID=A0ABN3I8D1_9ACTN
MAIDLKKLNEDVQKLKSDMEDSKKWVQSFQKKLEYGYGKAEAVGGAAAAVGGSATATGISGEFTGASAGLKLFNAEHTVFDLKEQLDRRRGLLPEQIKASVDRLYPVVARLNTQLPEVRQTARKAHERLDRIQPRVGAVESSLRSMRSRVGNNVAAGRTANFANLGSFSEAASHINRLENRVNTLIAALG